MIYSFAALSDLLEMKSDATRKGNTNSCRTHDQNLHEGKSGDSDRLTLGYVHKNHAIWRKNSYFFVVMGIT